MTSQSNIKSADIDKEEPYTSPFEKACEIYAGQGYHPITIGHGTKQPAYLKVDGSWANASWSKYRNVPATAAERARWGRLRDRDGYGAGIGIVLGTPAGSAPDGQPCITVAIDVDPAPGCDHEAELMTAINAAIPDVWCKKGGKGGTFLVRLRASETEAGFDYGAPGGNKVQLLLNAQTVMPPSVHPVTGKAYYRLSEATRQNADALPIITLEALDALLGGFEYVRSIRAGSALGDAQEQAAKLDVALGFERDDLIAALAGSAGDLGDLWLKGADSAFMQTPTRARAGQKAKERDRSGSGLRLELARQMARAGYSGLEFQTAVQEWAFATGRLSVTGRDIHRAWGSAGLPAVAELREAAAAKRASTGAGNFSVVVDDAADPATVIWMAAERSKRADRRALEAGATPLSTDPAMTAKGRLWDHTDGCWVNPALFCARVYRDRPLRKDADIFDRRLPFEVGSVGLIIGQTGTAKSAIAVELCAAMSMGRDAIGAAWANVSAGPVACLYINGESNEINRDRVQAQILRGMLSEDAPLLMRAMPTETRDFEEIFKAAKYQMRQEFNAELKVAVVDTFASVYAVTSENENSEISKIIADMKRIAMKMGIMVIIVHHAGKNAALGARGGSAFGCDAEFQLDCAKIEREGHAATYTVRTKKHKAAGEQIGSTPFGVEAHKLGAFVQERVGRPAIERSIWAVVVVAPATGSLPLVEAEALAPKQMATLSVLIAAGAAGLTATQWQAACVLANINPSTARDAIIRLTARPEVRVVDGRCFAVAPVARVTPSEGHQNVADDDEG